MNSKYLFPHRCKKLGWILFVPAFLIGSFLWVGGFDLDELLSTTVFAIFNEGIFDNLDHTFVLLENGIADELLSLFIILGGLLIGFSKEKEEDEFIAALRTASLVWATYVNYGILLLAIIFVYGFAFFDVLVFNMFTTLIFFITRFHFALYKTKRSLRHEE